VVHLHAIGCVDVYFVDCRCELDVLHLQLHLRERPVGFAAVLARGRIALLFELLLLFAIPNVLWSL
jgi:hypothetical protein